MIKLTIRAAAFLAVALGSFLRAEPLETLHQFNVANGKRPETALTVGPDGALYGTTLEGGTHNAGVIFRYDPDGEVPEERFTKIKDLDPAVEGSFPIARLLNIGDGNLYGACKSGTSGTPHTGGTVFKIDSFGLVTVLHSIPSVMGTPYRAVYLASGEPGVLHVLCEDNSGIRRVPLDGGSVTVPTLMPATPKPQSFIRANDGFLYGVTIEGGVNRKGAVFRTNADGSNYSVIHEFDPANGQAPKGAMVQGQDGNLYGVTTAGGVIGGNEVGVVYRLKKVTADQYSYTVIHRFKDFDEAHGDLLLASDGMLYGTCKMIGPGGNGNGGVWRIRTDGTGYKVLHTFLTGVGAGYPTGRNPVGGLVQGLDGHIYGTTTGGIGTGAGTIFRLKLNLPPPPVNRPPLAVDDIAVVTGSAAVDVPVLANDFEPDNDGVLVSVEQVPAHGTAQVLGDGTIRYTPDGSFVNEDSFTYKIDDFRGGESIATVRIQTTAPPALFQPGTYNGLVVLDQDLNSSNPQPRGQFQLTVKPTGTFTGTLVAQGKRVTLRGTFTDGVAVAKATMPDRKVADVFFTFQAGSPSTIFAAFFGTEIWTGEAAPVVTSGETKNLSYTIQIESNPAIVNGPIGHGYGTVTVKPTGAVLVVGKLGDGSNLKWSTSLTELSGGARVIPTYSEPIKGGVISGLLIESTETGIDFYGTLKWSRPAASKSTKPYALGFTGEVDASVARFIPPTATGPVLDLVSAAVEVEGAGVPATSGIFTIDGKKITVQGNLKSFTINRATGIFSGVMKNGTKSISFKGAVNQSLKSGFGHFSIGGVTGSAEFVF